MQIQIFVVTTLLCFGALGEVAGAQRTWIVDRLNRPGTSFQDLPAAVAAAAPGDVLLLRYVDPRVATYTATRVSRGLSLIGAGSGRPGIEGLLEVVLLPAGEEVFLTGLLLSPFATNAAAPARGGLRIDSNRGAVHLVDIVRTDPPNPDPAHALFDRFSVHASSFVSFSDCTLQVVTHPLYGHMAFSDTDLLIASRTAFRPHGGTGGLTTIALDRSTLVLVDSTVQGGMSPAGNPAIRFCSSRILVQGPGSAVTGGRSLFGPGPAPAFQAASPSCATGTVVTIDPAARVGAVSGVPPVFGKVPVLAWSLAGAPPVLSGVAYGHPGAASIVAVGVRLRPPVATNLGMLFIDPLGIVPVDAGVLDAQGRRNLSIPLGSSAALGLSAWMQGLQLSVASGLELTSPAPLVVR